MNKAKDSITLSQVRKVMEMLASKQECCITAIEISPVQTEIGKGSNGTVGAFVSQVKLEYINAKELDRSNISTQFKSAIKEEIDRFADNARDNASEGLAAVEKHNEELLGLIDNANENIHDLEKNIETLKEQADKEIRRLSDEMAKTAQKIESQEEAINQHKDDLSSYRNGLTQANIDINLLTKQVGGLEADLKTAQTSAEETVDKLKLAISSREEAERKAISAEQAAANTQQTIDLLTSQAEKLEQQIDDLKDKETELTRLNGQLYDKLETTNLDRIEDLKTANTYQSGDAEASEETQKKGGKGK